ncbi:chemotaxis protein histidine kinase CheA [Hypnocyclicus thermotrophus]|uniref:Chemotaxis protein CheA n=1 Tax=Hypnocyclicus thermotrophus TaxID=1627895 RepID=A0AA46I522_9FUSO|nr:ATP-binding protein [Hypnocyclicus thermotrophus]TDT68101.1 chemotaxis protein histidine kinase CheA [Hypnocyclicus thermotrophus]
MDNSYIKIFFEEVYDIVEDLEKILYEYNSDIDEETDVQIRRHFHTLKGDFATFDIDEYSKFFHEIEDRWKEGKEKEKIVREVLDKLDEVREFIKVAENEGFEKALSTEFSKNQNKKSCKRNKKEEEINLVTQKIDTKKELGKEVYTFHLKFYEERSLKIKEIEQLFDFYGKLISIDKEKEGNYKVVVLLENLDEIKGMLEVLLSGEGEYSVQKGEIKKKNKEKKLSSNIEELKNIQFVRIETNILDSLLNSITELSIKQSGLYMFEEKVNEEYREQYIDLLSKIKNITKELQEDIFQIRLIQANVLFYQLNKIVKDICIELDKDVQLEILGETTKIDKTILEKIAPSLKHMIKNSLDHGIESRGERRRKGKIETGHIRVEAYQENDFIVIEIEDDGVGLDSNEIYRKALEKGIVDINKTMEKEEILQLIFLPGFSTSDYVTEISGRGIGMDVVKSTIEELGGEIRIETETDKYTRFILKVPNTISIIEGFLVKTDEKYIIPLSSVEKIIDVNNVELIEDKIKYKGEEYEVGYIDSNKDIVNRVIMILKNGDQKKGYFIKDILDEREYIIRDINVTYDKLRKYSGVTILGNGELVPVINPKLL